MYSKFENLQKTSLLLKKNRIFLINGVIIVYYYNKLERHNYVLYVNKCKCSVVSSNNMKYIQIH